MVDRVQAVNLGSIVMGRPVGLLVRLWNFNVPALRIDILLAPGSGCRGWVKKSNESISFAFNRRTFVLPNFYHIF